MRRKNPATDPLPPLRSPATFYLASYSAEFITLPNDILENSSPSPQHNDMESALDTLMLAGTGIQVRKPVMTFYHGHDNAPLIFSGFDLWTFRRQDIVQLVDAVLQGGWGMTRQAPAAMVAPQTSPGQSREAAANELRQRPRTTRTIH